MNDFFQNLIGGLANLSPSGRAALDRRQQMGEFLQDRLLREKQQNMEQTNSDRNFKLNQDRFDQEKTDRSNAEADRGFGQQLQIAHGVSSGAIRPVTAPAGSDPMPSPDELEQASGRPTFAAPSNPAQRFFAQTPDELQAQQDKLTAASAAAKSKASNDVFEQNLQHFRDSNPDFVKNNPGAMGDVTAQHYLGIKPEKDSTDAVESKWLRNAGDMSLPQEERDRNQALYDHALKQKHPDAAGMTMEDLTPEALDNAARQYALTGQMPPVGMGKDAVILRKQIMNRAGVLYSKLDLATNNAAYKANSDSLKGLIKGRDALDAFERTAGKNLDLFIQQAGKVADSGSPWINKALRDVESNLLGNEEVPAYNAARNVATSEIAKVTSNPSLSGQLTEGARKEVEGYNPTTATFAQTLKVASVLRADMKNRHDELDQQVRDVSNRIGQGGDALKTLNAPGADASTTGSAPPPPKPGTPVVNATPNTAPAGAPPMPPALPHGGGKKLDAATGAIFLKAFGGDKAKAQDAAKRFDWTW